MASNQELATLFFKELKKYNLSNFRQIARAPLTDDNAATHKAFSSVVTRFFIFLEKHPEITATESNILFYKLKIDMISRYFAEYPSSDLDQLKAFQLELKNYIKTNREEIENEQPTAKV